MKTFYTLLLLLFISTSIAQVGIGKTNPNFILDINASDANLNGINIDQPSFNSQFLAEESTTTLVLNNSLRTGDYNFRFNDDTRFIFNNSTFMPSVNSSDNLTSSGIDIGKFNAHFRRIYAQGIHTNDNGANGGLRINIGSGGGTSSDYIFSDFDFYPTDSETKDLGRNGNFWNNFYCVNSFTPSDQRLKENIKTNSKGLEMIKSIKTYQYNYISDKTKKTHYGVMAQELQQLIPELVDNSNPETGMLAVNYTETIPMLIKATQEQNKIIESQAAKIERLEAEMELIKQKLNL